MKYEYMVEYISNGTKPDLPDDVVFQVKYAGSWNSEKRSESTFKTNWPVIQAFRIVDPRYKPAPEQGWYDYEKQVAAGLPPVGACVEYHGFDGWSAPDYGRVFHITKDGVAFVEYDKSGFDYSASIDKFRPLDWDRELNRERDEAIKAGSKIAELADDRETPELSIDAEGLQHIVAALYDAGWRPQEVYYGYE